MGKFKSKLKLGKVIKSFGYERRKANMFTDVLSKTTKHAFFWFSHSKQSSLAESPARATKFDDETQS